MRVTRIVFIAVVALFVGLALHAAGTLKVDSGTWAAGPSMSVTRTGAASVLMPDGRILVSGGNDANGNPTASAQFFNADGSFSDAPAMGAARSGHAAVWLPTGYVLVAGGTTSGGGVTNTAELFDPLANQWVTLPSTMIEARTDFTATVLRYGNVVIAGGTHAGVPVSTVEVFDVSAEAFSAMGALSTGRANAAAAAVSDFKVLVVGGADANGLTLASTEVIDTEAAAVTPGPAMSTPRQSATATVLLDGRVLIAGGSYAEGADANGGVAELASTDIYDPVAGAIGAGPSMSAPRAGHQALLLPNNNSVLMVGGVAAGQDLASADLFTPATGSFAAQPSMAAARRQATGSAMYGPAFRYGTDGVLLVAGGSNQSSSELYGFATVKTDKDDYAPGTPVIITGSGWVPGETVTLSLLESPNLDTHTLSPVTADANGNIYSDEFAPDVNDLNIKFLLTASGSKTIAQNLFYDSVTSVSITSVTPTASITSLPATVTVAFNYVTSATGTTTATLDVLGLPAGTPAITSQKSITPGTGSDSLSVTVPAGTPNGSYNAKITVQNLTGTGANNKNDQRNGGVVIAVPVNVSTSTVISSSSATPKYGDNVTFTATVSPASGAVAPTGSIAMKVDGSSISASTSTVGTSLVATFSTSLLTAGAHKVDAAYTATGNFNSSSASQFTQNVGQATLTVTADDKNMTFGGAVPTLTYTPTGFVNGENSSVLSGSPALSTTATSSSAAGNYPITVAVGTLSAANYTFAFVNGTLAIGKADVTVAWSNTSVPYNGASQAITATPTPSGAALNINYTGTDNLGNPYNSATGPTNAGNYTATATLVDTTNYKFAGGAQTTSSFAISKATPTVHVSDVNAVFDGNAHAATGTVEGVGGVNLGSATINYTPGGSTAPINAGSYAVLASFAGDGNYEQVSAGATVKIDKANSSTVVTFEAGPYTYRGSAFTATAHVTGAGGLDQDLTPSYSGDCVDVTSTDGCTATANFAGDDNHYGSNDNKSITIEKASSTVTVKFESGPYTYRGTVFTATAHVTGAGGLDQDLTPTYSGDCTNVSAANGCTANANFAGDTNHFGNSDSKSITIEKAASTVTVAFEAGPYTYRGTAFTATAHVTGVGGLDTTVAPTYVGDCVNVTSPNGCTANASFAGDTNHFGNSDSKSITIEKAASTVTVAFEAGPYTYRGTAFIATAHVTGAGGLDTNVAPTYTGDCVNVTSPNGCTANASYSGDSNHDGNTGNASITIIKASSSVTVTFEAGPYVYRASVFTATAHATGVGGLNQALTPSYSGDCLNVTVAGGCKAEASFAGDQNHDSSIGSASITILKAPSTVTVTFEAGPYIYRGTAFTATAGVTGVGGLNQALTPTYSGDCVNVSAANGCTASATFLGDTNHDSKTESLSITILKANPVITWSNPADIYYGTPLSGTQLNATANVPGGFAYNPAAGAILNVGMQTLSTTFTPTDTTNYNNAPKQVQINVKAWTLSGFYQPVTPTPFGTTIVWNTVKGGSTVPLKFNIFAGGTQLTDVADVVNRSVMVAQVPCTTSGVDDAVDYVTNTGSTALRYDSVGGQFIQNWQTPKPAGLCYFVRMTSLDGSKLDAYFKTK